MALDLLDNRVTIGDGKDSDEATLHLDVSLVTPFPHVKGSVVQVIGEMHVVGKVMSDDRNGGFVTPGRVE